jgi:hypothetical protein
MAYSCLFFLFALVIEAFFFHQAWRFSFKIYKNRTLSTVLAILAFFAGIFIVQWLSTVNSVFLQRLQEATISVNEKTSLGILLFPLAQLIVLLGLVFFHWRRMSPAK